MRKCITKSGINIMSVSGDAKGGNPLNKQFGLDEYYAYALWQLCILS